MAETHKIFFDRVGKATILDTPFFPFLTEEDGERKISFNQGYIFVYPKPEELELSPNIGVKKITVQGCEERSASANEYYINISMDASGNVQSAEVSDQQENVSVPICSINEGSLVINELFVRENIHLSPMGSGSGCSGSGCSGSGYIKFLDCDSAELGRLDWSQGRISTNAEYTFKVNNCSGGSGGGSGSGMPMYFIKDGYLNSVEFLVLPDTLTEIGAV